MYKVVLADDNELSRKAVRNSVSWKNNSCKIAGEAADGICAYEMISRIRPQIALLDIKMPGMTGLEVIRKLQEEGVDCLYILITAYDDFTFAREGLKMGVFDYLLKPVAEEELQKVIQKAVDKISQKVQTSGKNREKILLSEAVLGDQTSAAELFSILQEEGRSREYCVLLATPAPGQTEQNEEMPGKNLVLQAEKILTENQRHGNLRFVCCRDHGEIVILMVFRAMLLARDYNLTALKCANSLAEGLKTQGSAVTVSISEISDKPKELRLLYEHAVFSRDSRFFLENQEVIHYDSLRTKSLHGEYAATEYLENFYAACRERPEQMEESLEQFLKQLNSDKNYDVSFVRSILVQTAIMMTCLIWEKGVGGQSRKNVNEIIKELEACKTVQEASDWLRGYAQALNGTYQDGRGLSVQTKRIMDFLYRHYAEHISLQNVSEALNLSETHICRLLKNDTGETFVTLLNKIRIQAATRMLREGGMKVYEVAEKAGFSNYAYFYQMFKRETGCSPTEIQ